MSVFNSLPPKINKNHLIKWLKLNYSFLKRKSFKLKPLNSERDKNFLIVLNSSTKKFVIKISNTVESKKLLDLQDYVLKELNKNLILKKFIPEKIHSNIKIYSDLNNRKCFVRILSYIDGKMYANSKQNSELERSLGILLGYLSKELQNLMKRKAKIAFRKVGCQRPSCPPESRFLQTGHRLSGPWPIFLNANFAF